MLNFCLLSIETDDDIPHVKILFPHIFKAFISCPSQMKMYISDEETIVTHPHTGQQ